MENKNLTYTVTNINKLGGVKCSPSESDFAHTERPSAHVSVRKVAFLVSLLCMGMALLTLTACSEDDASSIENNPDTETRINAPSTIAEPTDSTDTSHAVISDWEEGKAGGIEYVGSSMNGEN